MTGVDEIICHGIYIYILACLRPPVVFWPEADVPCYILLQKQAYMHWHMLPPQHQPSRDIPGKVNVFMRMFCD